MADRLLRQHYGDGVPVTIDPALGSPVVPWRRHRERLLAALEGLTDEQWAAASRCDLWSVQDVVSHLRTADAFFAASLTSGAAGTPTEHLRGFDPADTPEALVEPSRALTPSEVLAHLRHGTEAFAAAVAALDDAAWQRTAEAPPGHVPARLVLAHSLWDSWLHERDILLPLGIEPVVEPDELAVATWYALALGCIEGGLVGDPEPVGPGLTTPFDVTIAFDDLPDLPLRVQAGSAVELSLATGASTAVGSAVELGERCTGRVPLELDERVPRPLAEQLDRAFGILQPS